MYSYGMKTITLTQGMTATIDDCDDAIVCQYRWTLLPINAYGYTYARTTVMQKTVLMHRLIMAASKGKIVDHINHDTLDNRRCNLRITTQSTNGGNQISRRQNTSSTYRGVSQTEAGHWRSQIQFGYKKSHLGIYDTPEDAARAWNVAAQQQWGNDLPFNVIANPFAVPTRRVK